MMAPIELKKSILCQTPACGASLGTSVKQSGMPARLRAG
jgi:hypothetical protein